MKNDTRIVEITSCGECPFLDRRWENPPWQCEQIGDLVVRERHMDSIYKFCPLATKKEYLKEETRK